MLLLATSHFQREVVAVPLAIGALAKQTLVLGLAPGIVPVQKCAAEKSALRVRRIIRDQMTCSTLQATPSLSEPSPLHKIRGSPMGYKAPPQILDAIVPALPRNLVKELVLHPAANQQCYKKRQAKDRNRTIVEWKV